ALRNAAEARIKTSSAIRPSSSRRLRKFREGSCSGASRGLRAVSGASFIGAAGETRNKHRAKVGRSLLRPHSCLRQVLWVGSLFLERRRRIIRQLVLAGVGALYFELVEEQRGADNGGGDAAGAVADLRIVADSDQIAAQSADVKLTEDGAADELLVAIRVNAIQQARRVARAERFDTIAVGLPLVGDHLDDALLQFFGRLRFLAFEQQHAQVWRGIGSSAGAAMAVGRGEIADGL